MNRTTIPGEQDSSRQQCLERLKVAARESLELHASLVFTDVEWARAEKRLLDFATLLHGWEQVAQTTDAGNEDGRMTRKAPSARHGLDKAA
jgi:hypothetical protein